MTLIRIDAYIQDGKGKLNIAAFGVEEKEDGFYSKVAENTKYEKFKYLKNGKPSPFIRKIEKHHYEILYISLTEMNDTIQFKENLLKMKKYFRKKKWWERKICARMEQSIK